MLRRLLKNLRSKPAALPPPSLMQLHANKGGKVSDKWESYFSLYERHMSRFRTEPIALLEIGVQNGGSLEVWAAYFTRARAIVGCDIDPLCGDLQYADPRIKVVVGDASSSAVVEQVLSIAAPLDIVIDDGSHKSADIIAAFLEYFPRLSDRGVFIAEDMHAVYRPVDNGGVLAPLSAQEFFKLLVDIINVKHWTGALTVDALLSRYMAKAPDWLHTIESVEFSNSVVVVRKGRSRLGQRVIAGREASVRPVLYVD